MLPARYWRLSRSTFQVACDFRLGECMKVLVTGGAGYIGSHTLVELAAAGHCPVVLDNFSNSTPDVIERVVRIAGLSIPTYEADIRDRESIRNVFRANPDIEAVIHFAGLKAVGESVSQPLDYYINNVVGSLNLFAVMEEFGCSRLIFSSSASVYGEPTSVPIRESAALAPASPYARTKLQIEDILRDLYNSNRQSSIGLLRYFNPVGAHPSGLIGENPTGTPSNLMPYIAQVAVGWRDRLRIFGGDYPTPDGTGVRDYIHVVDLARGHVNALNVLSPAQMLTLNLGTGRGYSVLEVVRAFEQACGRQIPFEVVPRRSGDVAQCYADPMQAHRLLAWTADIGLEQMCRDAWNWQVHGAGGRG